jgi:microcystin-dependent protein
LNGSSSAAETNAATGGYLATVNNAYTAASNVVAMSASEVGTVGGSQAHVNMQPFLALNFCIALQGIFPSQN